MKNKISIIYRSSEEKNSIHNEFTYMVAHGHENTFEYIISTYFTESTIELRLNHPLIGLKQQIKPCLSCRKTAKAQ